APTLSGARPKRPVLAAIGVSGLGLCGATQYFAHEYGGQPALGSSLSGLYPPWRILIWVARWHRESADVLMRAGSVGLSITAVGLLALHVRRSIAANTARA